MKNNISTFIENNWDELKDKIHTHWKKFTEEDLEEIGHSPKALVDKLKTIYHHKAEEIEDEISNFLSKHGFDKNAVYELEDKAKDAKDVIWNYADLACQYLKKKSQIVERSAEKRVQKNPLKSIGIAVLGGLILAKVLL